MSSGLRGSLFRGFAVPIGTLLFACAACATPSTGAASPGSSSSPSASVSSAATATLTAAEAPGAIKAAYQSASAVHVKGSLSSDGTTVTLDIQLNKDSASGTVGEQGTTIPVRWVNGVYYFQFTDSVIRMAGESPTSATGRLLKNKWVPSTSSLASGLASSFKDLLTYGTFLQNTIGQIGGSPLTAAGASTVDGVSVQAFKGPDGSTADVATSTPHYLMRIVGPPSDPGTLDLTGWNQPVPVSKPVPSETFAGP